MNAKEYLMQAGIIDAKLKTVEANIRKLRSEILALGDVSLSSSWPDGQPHGTKITDPTGSQGIRLIYSQKREELRSQLIDYEYEQIILQSKLWAKRIEITDKIAEVMQSDDALAKVYYRILTMRYIDGASWEAIAVDIGYTWRHTIRLHGEALPRMEKILTG